MPASTATPLGCAACSPALGASTAQDLPEAWLPYSLPAHWGMAQHLRVALAQLWRCRDCGTVWTAAYDQYQAYHYAHRPLSIAALAALQADAGVAAVHALMAAQPPAFLLRALLDAPYLTLDAATRRRLAHQAERGDGA